LHLHGFGIYGKNKGASFLEAQTNALISTHALTKVYRGFPAVSQASFEVQPGDVFGLLGPNGAGKTTVIRMLLGLVKPTSGTAVLFGKDIAHDKPEILRRTAAIVESPALYPHLTGWENLRVMALSAGVNDPKRLEWALEQMDMRDRAKDRYRTYSLGMKQRLCIAAALLTDPQLIILDEPTNGLDPAGMRDIRQLIRQLADQGRTVLLSSHLLNEVEQVCNRVAIIVRGQIIAQGVVNEMLAASSYIQLRVHPSEVEQALGLLRAQDWLKNVRVQNEYILVDGAPGQGAAINQMLGQNGIFAGEIIPRTLSLEDFFLNVTAQPQPAPNLPLQEQTRHV
jgi:ABC-2 type transport system ATP-binding protein